MCLPSLVLTMPGESVLTVTPSSSSVGSAHGKISQLALAVTEHFVAAALTGVVVEVEHVIIPRGGNHP